jgi:hypothetical protein
MRVNGRATVDEVTVADLVDEARHWRLDTGRAEQVVADILDRLIAGTSDSELPRPFAELVRKRCEALATGSPAST